ncbi:MAG: ABC transporter permease, partial [Sulfitobacter sp.]|nr:ABC transporter permease [Sulfitobacter sp.]
MEALTWTGSMGWLNPILGLAVGVMVVAYMAQILLSLVPSAGMRTVGSGAVSAVNQGVSGLLGRAGAYGFLAALALVVVYLLAGIVMGPAAGIFGGLAQQLLPVWIALVVMFALSITFKRKLGLYGKLFDSTVGMIGFGLVMFWVFTGVFGGVFDMLITHDSLSQVSGMKNKLPGTPLARAEPEDYQWFLLGGDNLARDVFSRLIKGSWVVVQIAPMATLFAFMVGITLGLPAGYYGGKLDVFLSFLENLILAFPVILLFYLLVTPVIVLT